MKISLSFLVAITACVTYSVEAKPSCKMDSEGTASGAPFVAGKQGPDKRCIDSDYIRVTPVPRPSNTATPAPSFLQLNKGWTKEQILQQANACAKALSGAPEEVIISTCVCAVNLVTANVTAQQFSELASKRPDIFKRFTNAVINQCLPQQFPPTI